MKTPKPETQKENMNEKLKPQPEIAVATKSETTQSKPAHLPDKFWDAATKTTRVDDLAKSYLALEQQHGRLQAATQKSTATNKELLADKTRIEKEKNTMAAQLQDAAMFGGDWQGEKQSTMTWAENVFGADIARDIMAQPAGLRAMQRMRQEMKLGLAEPNLLGAHGNNNNAPDEATLRRLMKTPGYWRDKKPEVLQKVQSGFDRLYGGDRKK
ncbi:MAG: hypothetical protein QM529_07235 [Hydrotalea sp.]|nr:hypothetical protein [Hydrotalea sp.]